MQTRELIVELRNRLLEDAELRKAFEKSVESALNECKPYMSESKIAEKILERLIG